MKTLLRSAAFFVIFSVASLSAGVASPAVPLVRAATVRDYQQVQSISGFKRQQLSFLVIVGHYCYFGWANDYVGGVYLASDASGKWKVLQADHGAFNEGDMLRIAPAMSLPVARLLVSSALVQSEHRKSGDSRAAPLARPATPVERRDLAQFMPPSTRHDPWGFDEWAVAGPWALVGFCNEHAAVTGLFKRNAKGQWTKLILGGGQLLAEGLRRYGPSMQEETAESLVHLATRQDTGCPSI